MNWKLKQANDEAVPFIEEFGWKPVEDGLWLSPYGSYLQGARVQPVIAKHLEELEIGAVRDAIKIAADNKK